MSEGFQSFKNFSIGALALAGAVLLVLMGLQAFEVRLRNNTAPVPPAVVQTAAPSVQSDPPPPPQQLARGNPSEVVIRPGWSVIRTDTFCTIGVPQGTAPEVREAFRAEQCGQVRDVHSGRARS